MPTYKIENGSSRDKAIKVYGGLEVVKAGKTATVKNAGELSKEQIKSFASQGVKITTPGAADPQPETSKPAKPKKKSEE
jgi:hypothetical protein